MAQSRLECFVVDIDGFAGCVKTPEGRKSPQIIIPREIGIVHAFHGAIGFELQTSYSLYFVGKLAKSFVDDNSQSLWFQMRRLHGYLPHTSADFPSGSLVFRLPDDPQEAAQEGIDVALARLRVEISTVARDSAVVLLHKGGPEGRWLARLAREFSNVRRRPVSVLDLNDLACPTVTQLLRSPETRAWVELWCRCSPKVHCLVSRGHQRWTRHCPQAECLTLVRWISARCYGTETLVARRPSVSFEGVLDLIARARRAGAPPPAAWKLAPLGGKAARRCLNYVRGLLMEKKEYATPPLLDRVVSSAHLFIEPAATAHKIQNNAKARHGAVAEDSDFGGELRSSPVHWGDL